MSASVPTREVARRAFAAEFNDASYTFKESDDERAPVYSLLPTGEPANRVFVVGTLTETEDVGEESEYWRGRIVDPTGTFFTYAGQYQPEAASALRETETPAYVSVVGKPRTYETDEGDVNVSLRPESITVVDADTRDRWVVETAERTLERIESFDAPTSETPTDAAGEAQSTPDPGGEQRPNPDAVGTGDEYDAMAATQYGPDLDLSAYRELVVTALEGLEEAVDVAAEA